ncbi:MAG: asparagine synthase (glutamine-hydrolyzing) [Verrucomicrobia bacterium]|nr:asparagine synthase (glutamine-hydrolyzing) [Verrucomicrobiota bacterium]
MCGIVGILRLAGEDPNTQEIVQQMAATINHRGPDSEGVMSNKPCFFGFRRLAIMDVDAVSPPFCNEDETVWSIANAEIYNSEELKSWLVQKGHAFRTDVDTETLPHLWEELGPEFVQHLNGMFAFAIWDERQQRLMLGRDRSGEKPLYYWHDSKELVFASELRAMLAHPRVPRAVDPVALRRYLLHGFFPAPLSPIAGIRKLPAGNMLQVKDGRVEVSQYWDLADHYLQPSTKLKRERALVEELDTRIARAVELRRRSDVPLGVFLSGGIDSSCILAHLTNQAGPGVQAFTIGHRDPTFDESRIAQRTAEHFGAEFNELVLGEADLAEGLQLVGKGFDEPLGDASTIPTLLLSHFTRQKVKVVLSGEGADELFAGYPTYLGNKISGAYQRLPKSVRKFLLAAGRVVTPVSMGNVGLDYLLERFAAGAEMDLVERHHTWFGSISPDCHSKVFSQKLWHLLEEDDPFGSARDRLSGLQLPDSLAELLYMDFTLYLQDDLLTKVDRCTMLASLESRAPFLDHDLAEFVAGIPSSLKLKGITTKSILRKAVRKRLPKEVLQQRKRGFNIPFSRWLLHGLGDELRKRFSHERVEARGLFNPAGITEILDEHMERKADHRKPLFALLAFDMWCDAIYGDGAEVPVATTQPIINEARNNSSVRSRSALPLVSGSP